MAVAFDNFLGHTGAAGADITFDYTPTGTPAAILILAAAYIGTDRITGITYGGTAMSEVSGSPLLKATGEVSSLYGYFLGSSVPTGTQSVVVSVGAATAGVKIINVISLTASGDVEVIDTTTVSSDALADPTGTLSLSGRTCFCALVGGSGAGAVGDVTPLTDWNSRNEHDNGAQLSLCYTYDTIGSTDVTAGWTQAEDDATMIAIAVSEVQAAGTSITATVGISNWAGQGASVAQHLNVAAGVGTASFAGLTASLQLSTGINAGVGISLWGGNAATIAGDGVPTQTIAITSVGARVFRAGKSRIIYGG